MPSTSWDPARLPSQTGRTIVITGGNAGIGYFASEQLAGAGARIVMASRSKDRANAAAASIRSRVPNAQVDFIQLDLSSLGSVREAAEKIRQLGGVDVLINNAGVTSGPNERILTEDGIELVVGTNAFGPYALTALAFPALKPGGRVVSLGSMATRLVKLDAGNLQSDHGKYNFFRAYGYSKHAVHAFALELQRRLSAVGSGVESLLAHPGWAVDALASGRPGITDQDSASKRLVDLISAPVARGKDKGAWPIVRAAVDPGAHGGEFYGPRWSVAGRPVVIEPVASSADPAFGTEFWRQAEAATGVGFDPK